MAFTIQAPWPSQRLSENAMRQGTVCQIVGKVCWRAGRYLGSMLYMDFGGTVQIPSARQGVIIQGEALLGVRDCYWTLSIQMGVIVDSNSISDDNASQKLSCLIGAFLGDFTVRGPVAVDFVFSNGVVLSLDTTNKYKTEDDIVEFVAPDGKIYTIKPDGRVFLSDEVSKVRFSQ